MSANARWFGGIVADGISGSGGNISCVTGRSCGIFLLRLLGLRLILQKDTNEYALVIDRLARRHYRGRLFGLGFSHFRVRVFEIFDTQD
jgi:hypothetical protein